MMTLNRTSWSLHIALLLLATCVAAGAAAMDWSGHWQSGPLSKQQDAPRFDLDIEKVNGAYRASLTTKLLWAVKDEPLEVRVEGRRISLFAPGLSGESPVIEGTLAARGDSVEGSWRFRYGTHPSQPVTLVRIGPSRAPDYLTTSEQPVARLLEVGGARLSFSVIEGSGVTVVMFAGAGRNSSSWLPVQGALARKTGARVVAYDPAGSGNSDFDDRPYDAEHELAQVHEGLAQFGPRTPIIVVGHSYGGLLAQIYAAKYPNDVKAVVLVDPVVPEYMTEARMPHVGRMNLSLASSDGPYHAAKTRAYRDTVAKASTRPVPAHIPVTLLSCDDLQWWEQDENRKAWRTSHQNFVAGNPRRRLVLAEGAGHFINQDRPELIVEEIAKFIVDSSTAPAAKLPLQPTRTVRFSTDEGTWLSLDVAPDGKTIVFDLLGDLYTMPVSGGMATRITRGLGFDAQPRYSPDGKTIVFVSDRDGEENLWLANADGSEPRALTRERRNMFVSPEWTPEGESIVVTKAVDAAGSWGWGDGPMDLYLYHRRGGAGVKLTEAVPATAIGSTAPGPARYTGAAFGDDPTTMYAAASLGESWQIVSLDRATATPLLRTDVSGSAMRPVISPNGRYIVYATRRDDATSLRLRDTITGADRLLLDKVTRDGQRDPDLSRDLMPGSSFTPDGRALITSRDGKLVRVDLASGEIAPIAFTAEVEQELGPAVRSEYSIDDARVRVRQVQAARPSPDGKRLAFVALDRLWVMELPEGTPRRLTADAVGEFFPTWSPDSRYVAYATWSDEIGGQIYRVRGDGRGKPKRLTRQSGFYERLAYTPDGRFVLAARGSSHSHIEMRSELRREQSRRLLDTQLVRIASDGGEAVEIMHLTSAKAFTPTHYGTPHFTRAADRIYLYDYRDGLVSVDRQGADRRAVLQVTGWDSDRRRQVPADDIVIAPDASQAVALVNQRLYLIELPSLAIVPTPVISVDSDAAAPLPVKRITAVGGDFAGWQSREAVVHYSLGSTYFTYDVRSEATQRVEVQISVPRARPEGTVVLRGARVITMNGSEVLENADLVVTGNRIAAIGPRGRTEFATGARIVDVSGSSIIPGFFDVHAHAWPAWGAHRAQPWEYAAYLAYGVTSIRDPQAGQFDVLSYGDIIDAGGMRGPRVFSTGRGVFAETDLRSLDDTRDVMRRYSEYYRTQTVKQYLSGGRMQRQWVAMAAHEQHLTATNEGGSDFKMNLTLMLDGYSGLEHGIRTFPLYRDVTELMARSGIAYTLTTVSSGQADYFYRRHAVHDDAKLRRFVPHAEMDALPFRGRSTSVDDPYVFSRKAADAARIVAAGGRVALGSHGDLPGLGVHWELWATQSGGMSPHDALRVATLTSAEALGLGRELGSLEVGKLADLQVLAGNPLLDITQTQRIRLVMKEGRLYDAQTLQEVEPRPAAETSDSFQVAQSELLGAGGALANAWADYDNDGDLDLAVSFESGAVRLYRNDGGQLTSVGAELGLPLQGDVARGLSWGDFDGDGYQDLYIGTAVEPIATRNYLYRNQRGVRFTESAAQWGVDLPGADSRQANWIDFDNDGDLDLFVAHRSRSNRLFRNDGNEFTDVTRATGLGDARRTVGSCWFDMDQDGDLDLFLANQEGDRDALYRNQRGEFTDIAPELGMDQPQRRLADGGVGCTVGDYDNDGDLDLFVATYGRGLLYRNDGGGRFSEVAKSFGLDESGHNVGASWGDFDNDGRLDLYVAGYVRGPRGIAPRDALYRNEGDRFTDQLPWMPALNNSDHGVQWADFDGDGDLDLSLTNSGKLAGGHPLLRNELRAAKRRDSLQVAVVDHNGRWTRGGAEVRIYGRNGVLLGTRLVATGDGYNSQSAVPVHFGLATPEHLTVEVTFLTPAGRQVQRLNDVEPRKLRSKPLVVRQNQ